MTNVELGVTKLYPSVCDLCRQGWPIVINGRGEREHQLPAPQSNRICLAQYKDPIKRKRKGKRNGTNN